VRRPNLSDSGPGPIDMTLLPGFAGEEIMDIMIGMAGRAGQPDDIAEALVTLAHGRPGWVNGHHLIVDGVTTAGFSAGWKR